MTFTFISTTIDDVDWRECSELKIKIRFREDLNLFSFITRYGMSERLKVELCLRNFQVYEDGHAQIYALVDAPKAEFAQLEEFILEYM